MLLKYTQAQKRIKATGVGKPQRTAGGMMRLTSGVMSVGPKLFRRVIKRPAVIHRPVPVKREHIPVESCENSNDSGLGFDHHIDFHGQPTTPSLAAPQPHAITLSTLRFSDKETVWPTDEPPEVKRRRLDIKLESDDANDNFTFPETVRQQPPPPPPPPRPICVGVRGRSRGLPATLNSQLTATSSDGRTQLIIACQPEQQHRARYQTEGSRGAVKDRTGNGFPVVKLVGYDRPAVLQVFIGTDQGRVAPHMFYQACRVSGKNSTPCVEKKIDGTIVIEVDMEPTKDMVVTCDCVGILKERNVDVEHRFPEESSGRSKKKSTRCRMVFRTTIMLPNGTQETLQATSQPIVCTQPPGVPEICKKSLSSCCARGGLELFILGKNFLKDTRVVFQEGDWLQSVQPDKEFLQQSHLVCVVPAYERTDITEPVSVRLVVESSGKASEPHTFTYLPATGESANNLPVMGFDGNINRNPLTTSAVGSAAGFHSHLPAAPLLISAEPAAHFMSAQTSPRAEDKLHPVMMWEKSVDVLMPPPAPALLPISVRRSSVQLIVPETLAPEDLKKEAPEISDPPKPLANVSDLSSAPPPSIDTFHRFVSNNSLPSINVSNYLSNIENKNSVPELLKPHLMNEIPRIMIPSSTVINKSMFACKSTNLLTTVDTQANDPSPSTIVFENKNLTSEDPHSHKDHLSVIVNSALLQEKAQDLQLGQPSTSQVAKADVKIENLVPNVLKQEPTATERLDAFVNSAAESHISPNPPTTAQINSVITENTMMTQSNELIVNATNHLTNLREALSSSSVSPSQTVSCTSPLQVVGNPNESSFVNNSPHKSPDQAQLHVSAESSDIVGAELQNMSQVHLVQSPPQLSSRQERELTNLQISLGQQLSQTTTSQALQNELNNLLQTQVQTSQPMTLQTPIDQQLSPPVMNPVHLNQTNLNVLQALSPNASQKHKLQNMHVSLEQQLTSQTLTSSQLNNLMQVTEQEMRNEVETLKNIQASLEHQLSPQNMSTAQMVTTEPEQPSNLVLNSIRTSPIQSPISKAQVYSKLQASLEQQMSSQMMTPSQTSHDPMMVHSESPLNLASIRMENPSQCLSTEVQALTNLQASLETHMPPQMMNTSQISDSLVNGNLGLNVSISTAPTIVQDTVNQVQHMAGMQNPLDGFSTQVINQAQSLIETARSLESSPSSTLESPQMPPSQSETLSNLQMTLNGLSSSHRSPPQPNHNTMSINGIQTPPHIEVNQVTPFQSSFEQQLRSEMMSAPIAESVLSIHTSQGSQALPMTNMSSSMMQTSHSDCITSNNLNQMVDSQGITINSPVSLMNAQQMTVSNSTTQLSPVILSTTSSCQSSTSVLPQQEIGVSQNNYSSVPLPSTVTLVSTNHSQHDTISVDMTTSSMMLKASQEMLTPNMVTESSSSALSMASMPNTTIQRNIHVGSQFDQIASKMTSVQAQNQFERCQENKELKTVEPPGYMMTQQAAVKKCEDPPLPQVPSEITQMSEHDLISYINPSCFDTV